MKSKQVERYGGEEQTGYSEMQVLKSPAGWYVGTIYTSPTDGFQEPGSRDSGYFNTYEEAQAFLEAMERGEEEGRREP